MSGYLRLIFAICVIYTHFGPPGFGESGRLSVFGFYLMSGFLMTRVLRDRYCFKIVPFAANRFLRLYPPFLVVSIVSIIALATLPNALTVNPALQIPRTFGEWVSYLTIVPLRQEFLFRPVPPSWSLAVEIINYAILWAITARSRWAAWAVFAGTVLYHAWSLRLGQPIYARYAPFYAAMLPFTLGSLIHHEGRLAGSLGHQTKVCIALGAFAVWVFTAAVATFVRDHIYLHAPFYYGSLAALAVVMLMIKDLRFGPRWQAVDRFMGDLSYPVFLSHYLVGLLLWDLVLAAPVKGILTFAITAAATICVSVPLAILSNRWIEPLRDRLRPGAKATRQDFASVVLQP